jgi:hypothetical protein
MSDLSIWERQGRQWIPRWTVQLHLPLETYARLVAYANDHRISVPQAIRRLIAWAIEEGKL